MQIIKMTKYNPFDLYTNDKDKLSKNGIKATKMIKTAVKRKRWADVERLQKRFQHEGAWDTASRDAIIKYWKKLHKKSPIGWM
jgi:hypothetical protein